jgi:peptidoglycan glycosyltransferase
MNHRSTEGSLLIFAILVLLTGFTLLFAAKLPEMKSDNTININTASPGQLASVLGISRRLAEILCEYRDSHGHFPNTASLSKVPLLMPGEIRRVVKLLDGQDITTLEPTQVATKVGIDPEIAFRLMEEVASWGKTAEIKSSRLAKIPVVSADVVSRADSHLRVRDFRSVVFIYWLYVILLVGNFLLLHIVVRKAMPQADPFILPCVLMLAGLGAMILFSIKDPIRDTNIFPGQVQGIFIGTIAAILPLTAKFRALRLWRYTYLYAVFAILLILLLALFGSGPGGAKLRLFGFHPVEIVKLLLTFFVVSYLVDRWIVLMDRTSPKHKFQLPLFRDIGPLAVMYFLSLFSFILVKDLGPMLLLFGMFVVMLYIATGRAAFIWVGVLLMVLTGTVAYKLGLGVFDVRVDMWLHPWKNKHSNGMHLGQALWGLATGGIWGSGLGLGDPEYMPRAGSDLVFSSIGEELGLIGSTGVLVMFCVIIVRGYRAAIRARTDFDRLLAAGVTSLLGIQTLIIVYGVLGLTPLTGVTLPFVSYGKSSVVASFLIVGLLLRISGESAHGHLDIRIEAFRALQNTAIGLLVLLLGVAGLGRLVWVQGFACDQYACSTITTPDADGFIRSHVNPRLKAIEASIPRGTIYDRNGRPLATSKPSEIHELGIYELARRRPGHRCYPYGAALLHIVGYFDPRCGGPTGLEKSCNNVLRGFDSYADLLPIYRLRYTPFCPKLEGKDIRLTIDVELQLAVERALYKYAGAVRDRRTGERKHKGAAVVIDVYTGEVLAAVSIPDFDPNELTPELWQVYSEDKTGDSILFNRAVNGVYTPGSVFKLVTAAAALENGLGNFTYHCRHEERNIRWRYDHHYYSRKRVTDLEEMSPHGLTDLRKAIRVSCNVFFANLGLTLGPQKLYSQAKKFRLSKISPPSKLAEDLPDNSYGQGTIQVAPIEMARVVACIANNGVMMKPHFIKDIRLKGKPIQTMYPTILDRPIGSDTAEVLRRAMADVVRNGTGRGLFDGLGVSVAGKTGSAENNQGDRMPHSWFVGFAPAEDPRIAFAAIIENGGYGRSAAGPVCREIVRAALE